MAVTISWTGFSPTMGVNGANVNSLSGTLTDGRSHIEKKIAQWARRPQFRKLRELMDDLNGAAAGANTALVTRGQVQARVQLGNVSQGGQVPIESFTVINRVTAAADVTQINDMLDEVVYPSSYPADASGNGGGGKNGF